MNVPYICLRCRRRIITRSHQFRGAAFVSLGPSVNCDSRDQPPSSNPHPVERIIPGTNDAFSPSLGLRSRRLQYPLGTDKVLESLFSSNQRAKAESWKPRYALEANLGISNTHSSQLDTENELSVLKQMLSDETVAPEDLWAQGEKTIRMKAWNLSERGVDGKDDNTMAPRVVFRDLLLSLCRARSQEPFRRLAPAPADVIHIYLKHGIMKSWWDEVLLIQIGTLVNLGQDALYESENADVYATENVVSLLKDIFDVWKAFFKEFPSCGQAQPSDDISSTPDAVMYSSSVVRMAMGEQKDRVWQGLPAQEDLERRRSRLPKKITDRFLYYVSARPPSVHVDGVSAAAILTHDCVQYLAKNKSIPQQLIDIAQPFLLFVEHLTHESTSKDSLASKNLLRRGISGGVVDKVLTIWGTKLAVTHQPVDIAEHLPEHSQKTSAMPKKSFVMKLTADLKKAVRSSDTGLMINIWRKLQSQAATDDPPDDVVMQVYYQFLSGFFRLRCPEYSTEVWNHMIRSGHQPQHKHWNAMLSGSARTGDLVSLRGIWSGLKAAGLRPDNHSWTTYIGGLIACGAWRQGLEALEELGQTWKTLPSDVNSSAIDDGLFGPSIVPVNGAISAFLVLNKPEAVPHILQWAKTQNLRLNTTSFNTMLKPLVRKNDQAAIDNHIASMQRHNCPPDTITLTIFLNGLLSESSTSFRSKTPEAQKEAILAILRKMEEQGLPPSAHTYSTVIDGLLSSHALNLLAARAILDHMAHHNIKPSPHIYTILASYYFAASPVNVSAIDALWDRIRVERGALDRHFYDRMVEGYARIGEVKKMLFFLHRASSEGKSPSWVALGETLEALKRARKWDLISDLVKDVLDERRGLLRHGEGSSTGRKMFWGNVDHLVEEGYIQVKRPHVMVHKQM